MIRFACSDGEVRVWKSAYGWTQSTLGRDQHRWQHEPRHLNDIEVAKIRADKELMERAIDG